MKKKRYLIKTVNFGKPGDVSRNIIERLLEKNIDISKITRKAIAAYFSTSKEFTHSKIQNLLEERSKLKEKIPEISNDLLKIEDKLNKLGHKLKNDE